VLHGDATLFLGEVTCGGGVARGAALLEHWNATPADFPGLRGAAAGDQKSRPISSSAMAATGTRSSPRGPQEGARCSGTDDMLFSSKQVINGAASRSLLDDEDSQSCAAQQRHDDLLEEQQVAVLNSGTFLRTPR